MKLKILIMPLIIVAIVVFSIWIVYPAYSNGVDGMKEKKDELKKEQDKLIDIQNKNQNIAKFSSQIDSLPEEKLILYKFIPETRKEEEIVNNLNFLASNSSLLVSAIDTVKSKEQARISAMAEVDASVVNEKTGEKVKQLPIDEKFEARIKLEGSYDKIKEFLGNVYKLDRYNSTKSLKIEKKKGKAGEVSQSVLSLDMAVNFNYLNKAEISGDNINDKLFSETGLDTTIISKIKEQKSINNYALSVDQKGKTNIFVP